PDRRSSYKVPPSDVRPHTGSDSSSGTPFCVESRQDARHHHWPGPPPTESRSSVSPENIQPATAPRASPVRASENPYRRLIRNAGTQEREFCLRSQRNLATDEHRFSRIRDQANRGLRGYHG